MGFPGPGSQPLYGQECASTKYLFTTPERALTFGELHCGVLYDFHHGSGVASKA